MRNSTSSILWLLIFSFGILWVLQDTGAFDSIGTGPQSLGEVNGDPISYEAYNNRVSFYTDQFNQQSNQPLTPEMRSMYEQQAWDDLVAARLVEQKMNDLGIKVTDSELVEMITGENPDPFIRQQFADETGQIDRIALQTAIDAPENTEIWLMIEQQLRDNRRQQKLNNFITGGMKVSSLDVRNEYVRNNSFADIRFIRLPYSSVTDDEISVSENELNTYYRNNPDRFKRNETYRFRYVSWDKTPTPQDTAATIQEIEELRERFIDTENDSLFLQRNQSSSSYRGAFVTADEIRDEFRPVVDLAPGEVSDVMMVNGDPHLFKKIEQRGDEFKFGVLSYRVIADPINTIDRLAEQAREFEFFASNDGFETEAERNEMQVSQATATEGNPFVPGIGQSIQLLNTLENMGRNDISDPVELNDRFLVVQLLEKTPEGTRPFNEVRAQVENLVKNQKRKQQTSERVSSMFSPGSDLDDIAESGGLEIQTAENIRLSSNSIPGAGREPKVVGAIFALETGQTSEPIEGENAIFIIEPTVLDLADANNMTSEEARQIRNQLEQQKFVSFSQIFIEKLKEDANIKDFRNLVLR